MGNTKVSFILPPARWSDYRYSLGVMYISSFLTQYGYDNAIIDSACLRGDGYSFERAIKIILEEVESQHPDIIGFTCCLNEVNQCVSLNKEIKKSWPEITTCIGGPQPTFTSRLFLEEGFDFVIKGEGEETMLDLIQCLEGARNYDTVHGISWKRDKQIVHNAQRPLIKDINILPYPAFEKVNMSKHTQLHNWVIRGLPLRAVLIVSSRGCPYSCIYCGCNSIMGKKLRCRNYANLYSEIQLLRDNYGVEAIWFADDILTISREHIRTICRVTKDLSVYWGCQARVDSIDEEVVREMKSSGCLQLDFGVESGSDRILKEIINKKTTVAQAKKAFQICSKLGMRTLANLMIGLPTETREEMNETIKLAREIKADIYVLSIATPLPGTPLWDMVNADDIIPVSAYDKISYFSGSLIERYNKSKVVGLEKVRMEFLRHLNRYTRRKKIRFFLSRLRLFWRLKNKRDRLLFELKNNHYVFNLLKLLKLY